MDRASHFTFHGMHHADIQRDAAAHRHRLGPAQSKGHAGHALVILTAPGAISAEEYAGFADFLRERVMKDVWSKNF